MRIGVLIDVDQPVSEQIEEVAGFADAGYDSAWAVQIFGRDSLTALALVGSAVPRIGLGTGVVPIHPRHPQALAQQALTVQEAAGGRLTLGIGLSHQMVVEGMWGLSYARGASYMEEYLEVLQPLLHGAGVEHRGELLTTVAGSLGISGVPAPSVVVAALGPRMLEITGRLADGTVTWMTGTRTVADHVVPTITAAAEAAGRPRPRVVVSLPVAVTSDAEQAKARIDQQLAFYPHLPSYRAMLDREGAEVPSDIALVGSETDVARGIDRLAEAGATELVAMVLGSRPERDQTAALLRSRLGS